MNTPLKIILLLLLGFAVFFLFPAFVLGHFLVEFSLKRHGLSDRFWKAAPADISGAEPDCPKYIIQTNCLTAMKKMQEWRASAVSEELTLISYDGMRLKGHIFPAKAPTHNWVVLVHGYRDTPENILTYALGYIRQGYNIFYLEQRAHGSSEGNYIGMGYPEHFDLLDWLELLISMDPDASIVLHGHSMGSATILMAAGEKRLPANVKCAIADCGFSSVMDQFANNLKTMFHLPAFPLLYICNLVSRVETGLDFRKGNTLDYVSRSHTPTLFIHGDCDTFVPTEMVYWLYSAAACEKQLYIAKGAAHAKSQYIDPEKYYGQVFDFIAKYI